MYNNRARVPDHPAYLGALGRANPPRARASAVPAGPALWRRAQRNARRVSRAGAGCAGAGVHPRRLLARARQERPFLHRAVHSATAARAWSCPTTRCARAPDRPVTIADIALQMVRALEWTWRNIARYGGDPCAHHRRRPFGRRPSGGDAAGLRLEGRARRSAGAAGAQRALDLRASTTCEPLQQHALPARHDAALSDADALRASPALWPAPRAASSTRWRAATRARNSSARTRLIRDGVGPQGGAGAAKCCRGCTTSASWMRLADPAHALHRPTPCNCSRPDPRRRRPYISRCSPALSPPRMT